MARGPFFKNGLRTSRTPLPGGLVPTVPGPDWAIMSLGLDRRAQMGSATITTDPAHLGFGWQLIINGGTTAAFTPLVAGAIGGRRLWHSTLTCDTGSGSIVSLSSLNATGALRTLGFMTASARLVVQAQVIPGASDTNTTTLIGLVDPAASSTSASYGIWMQKATGGHNWSLHAGPAGGTVNLGTVTLTASVPTVLGVALAPDGMATAYAAGRAIGQRRFTNLAAFTSGTSTNLVPLIQLARASGTDNTLRLGDALFAARAFTDPGRPRTL